MTESTTISLPERDARANVGSAILGRPNLGRAGLPPESISRMRKTVLAQAAKFEQLGGGLVVVPYPPELQTAALLLVSAIYGQLRANMGSRAQLLRPRLHTCDHVHSAVPVFVVHDLLQTPEIVDKLLTDAPPRPVIIATSPWPDWEHAPRMAEPVAIINWEGKPSQVIGSEQDAAYLPDALSALTGVEREAFILIASLDAFGCPVALDLLARALCPGVDLESAIDGVSDALTSLESQGLIHWVQLDDPPALLLATSGTSAARTGVQQLSCGDELRPRISNAIRSSCAGCRDDRSTVLRLLQSMLSAAAYWPELSRLWGVQESHRAWVRGLYQAVAEHMDRILEQISPREALLWARVLAELGEHPHAEAVLRAALAKDPTNPALLQSKARHLGRRALTDRNLEPAAKAAFEQAIRQSPDNPYVLQAHGVWAADLGDLKSAERDLRRALQVAKAPADSVYALIALADLSLARGLPDDADHYLTKAAAINPGNPYIPHLRGETARWRGDFDAARAAYLQTLEIDPHNVPAAQSLGDMALKRGHWAQAEPHLTRALAWQPDNLPTLHALGELRAEQAIAATQTGQPADALFQESERAYRSVLEIEPSNLHALLALGVLLARQGRYDEALAAVDESEHRGTREARVRALHVRGRILTAQGRAADAARAFKTVLDHDRGNMPALIELARLDHARGEATDLLLRRIRDAVSSGSGPASDDHKARNALGALLRELGDPQAAIAVLDESQARDPANAYTWMELSRARSASGDADGAQAARARAEHLRRDPEP